MTSARWTVLPILLAAGFGLKPTGLCAQVVPSNPPPTIPVEAQIPALPGATGELLDAPVLVTGGA